MNARDEEVRIQDARFLDMATRWWFWLVVMPLVVGFGGFGLSAFLLVRNRGRMDVYGMLACLGAAAPHLFLISQGYVETTSGYVVLQALLVAFGTLTGIASTRRVQPGFLGRVLRG